MTGKARAPSRDGVAATAQSPTTRIQKEEGLGAVEGAIVIAVEVIPLASCANNGEEALDVLALLPVEP